MPFGISTRSALRSEPLRARRPDPTPNKSLEEATREFRKPLPFRIAGPAIGIGAQKEVFPAVGREDVVIRVLRAESGFPPLAGVGAWEPRRLVPFAEEHANLDLVRRWGLPASRILATGQSLGRPADAVRRRTIGSKELFSLRDEDPHLYEELLARLFSGDAGPRAVRLLARFERAFARGLGSRQATKVAGQDAEDGSGRHRARHSKAPISSSVLKENARSTHSDIHRVSSSASSASHARGAQSVPHPSTRFSASEFAARRCSAAARQSDTWARCERVSRSAPPCAVRPRRPRARGTRPSRRWRGRQVSRPRRGVGGATSPRPRMLAREPHPFGPFGRVSGRTKSL